VTGTDRRTVGILAVGLASLSFAAILIRYCSAPAPVIAFWRMGLATLILAPVVLGRWRREPWRPAIQARLLPYTVGAGALLAVHFATWIASVQLTTVASSLILMSAQPVWAGLLGYLFLREPVPRRGLLAIVLAMAGVAVIAWGDLGRGPAGLTGDGLALVSGIAVAGYLTVGRHLRLRLPLTHYLVAVYGVSAVVLGLLVLGSGERFTGYDSRTWVMLGLLALLPSVVGHSLVNYAIRHIETYRVNLSILVEPVVSTILAAILFGEIPGARFYLGAGCVVAGVVLALWLPSGGSLARPKRGLKRGISGPGP
jgi:drug/metabolite transporter (DMT)-like permease